MTWGGFRTGRAGEGGSNPCVRAGANVGAGGRAGVSFAGIIGLRGRGSGVAQQGVFCAQARALWPARGATSRRLLALSSTHGALSSTHGAHVPAP